MNPHMIKRFGLPPLFGLCLGLFLFLVATPANTEEMRSVTNLKGETVIVPSAVPNLKITWSDDKGQVLVAHDRSLTILAQQNRPGSW